MPFQASDKANYHNGGAAPAGEDSKHLSYDNT